MNAQVENPTELQWHDESAYDYVPSESVMLALVQPLPGQYDFALLHSRDCLTGYAPELPSRRWLKQSY
jgi:hypothetical protein